MDLTKVQQEKALDSGLALGAVMLEIESVNGNKMKLELDFRTAWRNWSYASLFPKVKVGAPHDNVLHILGKSPTRRGSRVAGWERSWPFVPWTEPNWSFEELADIIHDQIPARAWLGIVRNWLRSTQ